MKRPSTSLRERRARGGDRGGAKQLFFNILPRLLWEPRTNDRAASLEREKGKEICLNIKDISVLHNMQNSFPPLSPRGGGGGVGVVSSRFPLSPAKQPLVMQNIYIYIFISFSTYILVFIIHNIYIENYI